MADRDELLDHNYDGIQEYDNDLPRWWVVLFWLTVVWGAVYAVWFHLPSTPTPTERLAKGLAALQPKDKGAAQNVGDETESLIALAKDAGVVQRGSGIFATKCAACHSALGQGLVGPNLTDNYWIHGGKITDIKRIILEGVPAKGMLSWKALLTADEVNAVVSFIWSIRNTNVAGGKAAEGQPVE